MSDSASSPTNVCLPARQGLKSLLAAQARQAKGEAVDGAPDGASGSAASPRSRTGGKVRGIQRCFADRQANSAPDGASGSAASPRSRTGGKVRGDSL